MTVVVFPPRGEERLAGWHERERPLLMQVFGAHAASGEANDWRIGATETGEPQFYILGPEPDSDCILSLSRVGDDYVLEDGNGNVIADGRSLRTIAQKAAGVTFEVKKVSIAARALVVWCVLRYVFEEEIEPLLAEPIEMMAHILPQLTAMA